VKHFPFTTLFRSSCLETWIGPWYIVSILFHQHNYNSKNIDVARLQAFRPPRLPHDVYHAKLVLFGDHFTQLKEYRLAYTECYSRFLQEHTPTAESSSNQSTEDLEETSSLTIRARLGQVTCKFHMALESDPELRKIMTVKEIVDLLTQCREIAMEAAKVSDFYWLTYNATITMMMLCTPLLAYGYASLSVEYLIFSALSLESQVPLNRAAYLGWRVRLYCAVCLAYEECKMKEEALAFAQRGLEQVIRLQKIEALDPVPPPADVKRILALNELEMRTRVARYSEGMSGADMLQMFNQGSAGSTALVVASTLKTLHDSTRRTLRHVPASQAEAGRSELIDALVEQLKPVLHTISTYIKQRDAPPPPAVARNEDGEEEPAEAAEGDDQAKEPVISYSDYNQACADLPLADHVMLAKHCYNYERWEALKQLMLVCKVRVQPQEGAPDKMVMQVNLLDELHALEHPPEPEEDGTAAPAKRVTMAVGGYKEPRHETRARRKLETLGHVGKVLMTFCQQNSEGFDPTPDSGADLLADTALLLWNHAEPLMSVVEASPTDDPEMLSEIADLMPPPLPLTSQQNTVQEKDAENEGEEADAEQEEPEPEQEQANNDDEDADNNASAQNGFVEMTLRQLATEVLKAVHATLESVRFDDGVVRVHVGLRLAQTLEMR
jgi:hypothetical protein